MDASVLYAVVCLHLCSFFYIEAIVIHVKNYHAYNYHPKKSTEKTKAPTTSPTAHVSSTTKASSEAYYMSTTAIITTLSGIENDLSPSSDTRESSSINSKGADQFGSSKLPVSSTTETGVVSGFSGSSPPDYGYNDINESKSVTNTSALVTEDLYYDYDSDNSTEDWEMDYGSTSKNDSAKYAINSTFTPLGDSLSSMTQSSLVDEDEDDDDHYLKSSSKSSISTDLNHEKLTSELASLSTTQDDGSINRLITVNSTSTPITATFSSKMPDSTILSAIVSSTGSSYGQEMVTTTDTPSKSKVPAQTPPTNSTEPASDDFEISSTFLFGSSIGSEYSTRASDIQSTTPPDAIDQTHVTTEQPLVVLFFTPGYTRIGAIFALAIGLIFFFVVFALVVIRCYDAIAYRGYKKVDLLLNSGYGD